MAIPELELARVERLLREYEDRSVPPEIRHELEIRHRIDGNTVIVYERRPAWDRKGEWVELLVAKFRWYVGAKEWELYWRDRNFRWHKYDLVPRSRAFEDLLDELDEDPTGIFWG